VLPSMSTLVLGLLLLPVTESLAPLLPLMAGSVVPRTGKDAAASVGAVTAAAAASSLAAAAAAQVATDGGLGGFCAGCWWCCLGGMMTEISMT